MPWYVIQTYTGREEKLMTMIRRIVPKEYYGDCFVSYYEQLWHRQQKNQVHILRMFPGYVFISSDMPRVLSVFLKKVPAMTKVLATDEFEFIPLEESEAGFLESIMDKDRVVRLSYVATDGRGNASYISGPLECCGGRVIEYQFRKRYAVVRVLIGGKEKEVRFGIILNNDVRREVAYGKVEAPAANLEKYHSSPERKEADADLFHEGDEVVVIDGAFEGRTAKVVQARRAFVKIGVPLFGRVIMADLPVKSVCRISDRMNMED